MAVEAAKWAGALHTLGFSTMTVAGGGPVDVLLPGLAIGASEPPTPIELADALAPADLVVVENLCSLPLNPGAAALVARALSGRPAVLHHHDLPWQRERFADHPPPPTDRRWTQVTINELSRRELAERGLPATTVYNAFSPPDPGGDGASGQEERRLALRRLLGVDEGQCLVLQPTRAIPRKNVAGGIGVAEALDAVYWLLGPAEDGYGPELDELMASARCPIVHGMPPGARVWEIGDAYRASDVVALPSTWEGFGNPAVESALHRRPLAVGPYPVANELAAFGFEWFGLDQMDHLGAWLSRPEPGLLDRNAAVATEHFSLDDLPGRIAAVLPPL